MQVKTVYPFEWAVTRKTYFTGYIYQNDFQRKLGLRLQNGVLGL
jgi:hypothetical protein